MIEDYINNFEFPVYEAVQNNSVYYKKPKDLLKMVVKSVNSYKNTPPCPKGAFDTQLRLHPGRRVKRYSISFSKYFKDSIAFLKKVNWKKEAENWGLHNKIHNPFSHRKPRRTLVTT